MENEFDNEEKAPELRETLFTIERMMVEKYADESLSVVVIINDDDDDESHYPDRLYFTGEGIFYEHRETNRFVKKSISAMSEEQLLLMTTSSLTLLIRRLEEEKKLKIEQKEKLRLENERKFNLAFEAASEAINLLNS